MHDGSFYKGSFITDHFQLKKGILHFSVLILWALPPFPSFPDLSFNDHSKRTSNFCGIHCITLALIDCYLFYFFTQTHSHTQSVLQTNVGHRVSKDSVFPAECWVIWKIWPVSEAATIPWAWICTHWRLSHRRRWKQDLLSLQLFNTSCFGSLLESNSLHTHSLIWHSVTRNLTVLEHSDSDDELTRPKTLSK